MNITAFVMNAHRAMTKTCFIDGIWFRGHQWSRSKENFSLIIKKGSGKEALMSLSREDAIRLADSLNTAVKKADLITGNNPHTFTMRLHSTEQGATERMEQVSDTLKLAHYFGAEAAANDRKYMSGSDRYELAQKYGADFWADLPEKTQQSIAQAWNAGHDAEERNNRI